GALVGSKGQLLASSGLDASQKNNSNSNSNNNSIKSNSNKRNNSNNTTATAATTVTTATTTAKNRKWLDLAQKTLGAGEMVHQSRSWTALPEVLSSIPSNYMMIHNHL
ncbi:mCG145973, partial [Mus musculus]